MRKFCGGLSAISLAVAASLPLTHAKAAAFAGVDSSFFAVTAYYAVLDRQGSSLTMDDSLQFTSNVIVGLDSTNVALNSTIEGDGSVYYSEHHFLYSPNSRGGGSFFVSGTADVQTNGYAYLYYKTTFTLSFTNNTGYDLYGMVFSTAYSGFNNGGAGPHAGIGAMVDFNDIEFARYQTSQSGPGIGDSHSCDTRDTSGFKFFDSTPPSLSCGVPSPDFSSSTFSILDFKSGETVFQDFSLIILAEAINVSEPPTLAILAPALITVVLGGWIWPACRRRSAQ